MTWDKPKKTCEKISSRTRSRWHDDAVELWSSDLAPIQQYWITVNIKKLDLSFDSDYHISPISVIQHSYHFLPFLQGWIQSIYQLPWQFLPFLTISYLLCQFYVSLLLVCDCRWYSLSSSHVAAFSHLFLPWNGKPSLFWHSWMYKLSLDFRIKERVQETGGLICSKYVVLLWFPSFATIRVW